ncbi:MAG: ComEA family DNA-binding protein [Clostridia bacterium]|nr:ComEA family DNA-binding protein [Clostridia bacterium]
MITGAGTAATSEAVPAENKRQFLLPAAAAAILALLFLLLAFDSPKYREVSATLSPSAQTIAQAPERAEPGTRIDINTADLSQLQQLKGVGEKKAQAILDYREKNGRFRSLDELTLISGISASIVENNRELLTLS